MTSEEHEKLNVLCDRIQHENDPKKFTKLLTELDRLLAQQQHVVAKTDAQAKVRQPPLSSG